MMERRVEPIERHVPAQDPIIRRGFWGYCAVVDWPFWRIIPNGSDHCPFCGETLPVTEEVPVEIGVTIAEERHIVRLEFYSSSKTNPAEQFAYNSDRLHQLLDQARRRGIIVKTMDVEDPAVGDLFLIYNAAVIGPPAAKRSVFGMKGALLDDFGRRVPALLAFASEADRYPVEVFPRMDRQLNRLVGVEEGLQMLLAQVPGEAIPQLEESEES